MIDPIKAHHLRHTPSAELTSEYARFTREKFSEAGVPVVIAARNEQEDLPATLLALADNKEAVHPIVVVNGSDDETAERATHLGATVLHSERTLKIPSLQMGVQHALDHDPRKPILFTDADTLVGKNWASSMTREGETRDGRPRMAWGEAVVWDGPNMLVDILRTARRAVVAVRGRSHPGGANMAIDFAGSEEAINRYMALESRLFIGEERAIAEAVTGDPNGGELTLGVGALVLTRGDRFTFMDLMNMKNNLAARVKTYQQYGDDLRPYVKAS